MSDTRQLVWSLKRLEQAGSGPKEEEPPKGGSWGLTLNGWFASEKTVPWAGRLLLLGTGWPRGKPVLAQTTKTLRPPCQNPENKGNG